MTDVRPDGSDPVLARAVRRLAVLALVLVVALGVILLAPPVALAAPAPGDLSSGREITRYDVTADAAVDGSVDVRIELDFDYGDDPGHGPYLTFPTRVSYDDEQDRVFEFSDVRASSPTGAPAGVDREDETSAMVLRIGDEDVDDVTGVQTYVVTFTVDGWINPANAQHSGDELYWNVIGPGWEIPLSQLSVTVSGPAPVEGAACFVGPYGSTTPCRSATTDGGTASFTQDVLTVGDQLTTVTGWPGGTFPGVQPILRAKPDPTLPLAPANPAGALAGALLLVGSGLVVRRVRRTGRDRAYLGLTPGLRPADGQEVATGYRDRRMPVSVQFQPPQDARPGEIGTLVDEKADPVDVTATIVDLAVRGWLRIEEVPRSNPKKKPKDWTLVRLRAGTEGLLPFEAWLLSDLFEEEDRVQLSDLSTTFASSLAKVQDMVYEHVASVGWFRGNPKKVRNAWLASAFGIMGLGVAVALVAMAIETVPGLALVGIAITLVGVLLLAVSNRAPARTADGTAVLAQALGFRRYLATAEANQLRFEEGEDVFSRYLPYAIVFGLTDRWARVFAELAAQGRVLEQPGWYVGSYAPTAHAFWATGFVGALDRFESVATSAITAPTPGSSGGSGFSGGGFSGGGVGGGGGGGW
ncbi:DUF2207 domain-containing protein [Cellulomonas iranensis]|uniref:DUF2207 domain-containing protein n=1 Tax=Cellulomonas iranensis TaxID=76862 RepID=UPI00211AB573|nr:DUF2207 domain-containing protein [Cellulomonas iranensis]